MEKMILTSETDIYAFFEIIDQTEADSILDVGMFLKRIGSVSRQVKDKAIPVEKNLIGVDFFTEISCTVWKTIYNFVFTAGDFFLTENSQKYELAMVLQLEGSVDATKSNQMWSWLSTHVSYVMTDWNVQDIGKLATFKTSAEITIDNKSYWFITL